MEEVHPSSNRLLLLLAASLAFTFFVFPSFLNLCSHIFPPPAFKKNWDFLILPLVLVLVLVLFAASWGFPSRSNHVSSGSYRRSDTQKSSSSNPIMLYLCYGSYDLGREYRFPLDSFYSRRMGKEDCDEEEKKFQTKHVVADDGGDRNAAVEEMEVPVILPPSALPGDRAAPKERKAKGTCQTITHKPGDDIDNPPGAPQVPRPSLPPLFHPLEEESGKERGGLATKECSSSLKTKKRNQKQKGIKNSKNSKTLLPSQPLPSSFHQPAPEFHTLLASKKGKKVADLYAPPPFPPPRAAPHKKKSHTPVTVTPNHESSEDSLNSGGLSSLTPTPPPPAFPSSPDVNRRADEFIATMEAHWIQEGSKKQRRSNLY